MTIPLVFLDVETTNTERNSPILEIAVVCVMADLREMAVSSFVVKRKEDELVRVWEKHAETGLIKECLSSRTLIGDAERNISGIVSRHREKFKVDGNVPPAIMAGWSVHFDLYKIEDQMPELRRQFSHRVIDLRTIRLFSKDICGIEPSKDDGSRPHRALGDCLAAVNELRHWREKVRGGQAAFWMVSGGGR